VNFLKKLLCGKVTHFFPKIGDAVIDLSKEIKLGDRLSFEGATTDFMQEVASMQVDKKEVSSASRGGQVGLKAEGRTRAGDSVYKLVA
jgi:hypothetical protein